MLGITQYFAHHDLSAADVLDFVRPLSTGESLLLVGSVAEGLASTGSDLDLLLIADESSSDGESDVVRTMPAGFDLNLEVSPRPRAETLCEWFESVLRGADSEGVSGATGVRFAGSDQLRLLHRLRTGIPLHDPMRSIEQLRFRYRLHVLPDFCMLQHVACHLRLRADAVHAASHCETALLMIQLAAQHLAGAMLASAGETNPNPKWLLRLLIDHRMALAAYPSDLLIDLILPGRQADCESHLNLLLSVSTEVITRLVEGAFRNRSPVANALAALATSPDETAVPMRRAR